MDIYSLRLNLASDVTGVVQNVLHYSFDGSASDSLRTVSEALIAGWMATVWPKWKPCLPTTVALTSLSARRVNNTGGPTYTILQGVFGTNAGPMGDSAMSVDIALAPVTFPWQPGHIYLGPIPAGSVVDNEWDHTYIVTVQALCDQLKESVAGVPVISGSFKEIIWSRKPGLSRDIGEWLIRPKPTPLNKRLLPYP